MTSVSNLLSSTQITSLIQQASTAFEAPATALQNQEKPISAQISALGSVQSALSGLQSALSGLGNVQSLSQRSVKTSPANAVTASVTNDATVGTYSLSNIHLAQTETLTSSGFASTSGSLGAGSLAIKIGSGSPVTVTVPSGQDTLSGIATAINQAGAGVQATVIYDGANYHLALTADTAGTAAGFTVSGSGGLVAFSYGSGASGLSETSAPQNASFSLNGLTITSGSNSISGVVPGLSLTLAASGSATVTVTQDATALDSAAQTVVAALNTALGTINQFTAYTPASGGGPLIGDVGLQIVRSDLLNAVTGQTNFSAASGGFNSLSSIGFTVTSSGTVTLDDSKLLAAAQTNYGAVASLLGNFGTTSNPNVSVQSIGSAQPGTYGIDVSSNGAAAVVGTVNGQTASGGTGGVMTVLGNGAAQGLALKVTSGVTGSLGTVTVTSGLFGQLTTILNGALAASTGSVTQELSNLNASITSMNKQIATLQKQALQQTQALTNQFSVAQATISQLTTVSDFLSSYFNTGSGSGS